MTVHFQPKGYHSITPYLSVNDGKKFLEFTKAVFDASVIELFENDSGGVQHGEVRIGDSVVMFSDANEFNPYTPTCLYLYIPDVDATYKKALENGATSIRVPADQFYGDRSGGVKDPSGINWWLGTHIEDVTPEELARRASELKE
ncbi:MAG: VOC family protein [Planctomycetes bacterium]|nr:VOC family protein [Planctomycetota bacterium]